MKIKYLFIKITACALCILGTQEAEAQKLYKEGEIIILDCGPDSGFPQTMVETQMGQKTIDNPSNSGGPATNNTETGNINQTVYIKLEIAGSDAVSYTHLDVYKRQPLTARPTSSMHRFSMQAVTQVSQAVPP